GRADVDVGRQRGEHRLAHLRRRAHVDPLHARRRIQVHRAGQQHHLGAARAGGRGHREAHLAAAAVAQEADRIDVLVGRPGAHQHPPAGQRGAHMASSAATIAAGSARRPGPDSPSASGPSSGPMTLAPRSRSRATLAWVAGCSHMRWFIAGHRVIGAVVARHRVLTRSSARPWASLAMVLAVAGAMTTRSAQRASSMWPIAASAAASHRLVRTGCPDSAWNVCAPTKRCALSVMATCTCAPASPSRRSSSAALYAAMPPHTHSSRRCPRRPRRAGIVRKVLLRIGPTAYPMAAGPPAARAAPDRLQSAHAGGPGRRRAADLPPRGGAPGPGRLQPSHAGGPPGRAPTDFPLSGGAPRPAASASGTRNRSMRIRDWPGHELPREKLLARGAGVLSDAELLAIFLGSGLRGQAADATAPALPERDGPLRRLLELEPAAMARLPGLGPARACCLAAALELGNRWLAAGLERGQALTDPGSA